MKHKKFYAILLISFVVSITNSVTLKAQQNVPNGLSKYEIAIDLQEFFSDGIPRKVLFKINNIKNRDKQLIFFTMILKSISFEILFFMSSQRLN
jgi:hypothetical protein